MSRIFITGDTHGGQSRGLKKLGSNSFSEGKSLTKDDYVIIAGDFGLIWDIVPKKDEIYYTKWLVEKKWTTLFIDGNHENFDRIDKLPQVGKFNGRVGSHWDDNIFHLKRGGVYTIGDKKIFTFGGARSIDKYRRVDGISWWAREEPNHSEYQYALENLEKNNWEVDYVITHDCPQSVFDFISKAYGYIDKDEKVQVRDFLKEVKNKLTFKKWYFGHHHIDIDIDDTFYGLFERVIEL